MASNKALKTQLYNGFFLTAVNNVTGRQWCKVTSLRTFTQVGLMYVSTILSYLYFTWFSILNCFTLYLSPIFYVLLYYIYFIALVTSYFSNKHHQMQHEHMNTSIIKIQ